MPSSSTPVESKIDLTKYFQLPEKEVAKRLGMCLTSLKKICRQSGISRWPYRKIKSLDKKLHDLEEAANSSQYLNAPRVQQLSQRKAATPVYKAKKGSPAKKLQCAQPMVTICNDEADDNAFSSVLRLLEIPSDASSSPSCSPPASTGSRDFSLSPECSDVADTESAFDMDTVASCTAEDEDTAGSGGSNAFWHHVRELPSDVPSFVIDGAHDGANVTCVGSFSADTFAVDSACTNPLVPLTHSSVWLPSAVSSSRPDTVSADAGPSDEELIAQLAGCAAGASVGAPLPGPFFLLGSIPPLSYSSISS